MKYFTPLFLCAATCFILSMTGCGGNSNLGQVEGNVTIDGQPAPAGLEITFSPDGEGQSSFGLTDESGHYTMMQPGDKLGVQVGMCTVYVAPEIMDEETDSYIELPIPSSFAEDSTQKFDVKPGTQQYDFNIPTK